MAQQQLNGVEGLPLRYKMARERAPTRMCAEPSPKTTLGANKKTASPMRSPVFCPVSDYADRQPDVFADGDVDVDDAPLT